jgi:AraC-like DNA-binding protein
VAIAIQAPSAAWRQANFCTSDFNECRDYIRDYTVSLKFDVNRERDFREFSHEKFSVGRIFMNSVILRSEDGFRITKDSTSRFFSFQFITEGVCEISGSFGSALARPGDVFVVDPNELTREIWSDNCRQFVVRIDRELVENTMSAELGKELGGALVFEPVMRDPGVMPWIAHISNLQAAAGNGAAILSDKRVARSLERTLLTMLLTGLRHSESEDLQRQMNGASPYYIRRAENYIRNNLLEELTIDDIAAAAGVSTRSLFYGFKRWRGETPMSYIRDARLDLARKELEKARMCGGTVSGSAMNAGFSNFSQFAKVYKARFGETPSMTLLGGN